MKHIKLFEEYIGMSDNDIIEFVTKLGDKLKDMLESEDFTVKNDGVNGIILTFIIHGRKKSLSFMEFKYNNLGLCLIDVKNPTKKYYSNDTYGYDYKYIPVESLTDEDYINLLWNNKY